MVIVTPFQQKKKQRNLIIILILALFGAAFLIWYKFFSKKPSAPRLLPEKPAKITINFNVLKNPFLTELTPFKEITPFKPEDAGRSNPFNPY